MLPLFLCFGKTALCQDKVPGAADTTVTTMADGSDTTAIADEDNDSVATETSQADVFVLRTLPGTLVRRWKKDPALAYANDPSYWHKEPEKPEDHRFLLAILQFLTSRGFRYTLYILLGALLIYAVIRIMKENNVRLFYRSGKKRTGLSGPDSPAEEMGEDLNQQLQHFIQVRDYRQATRYLYLISLTRLNEKGLIQWHRDATNQEYLLQLKGSSWEASFRNLTGIYDKVWYGEFPLGETQFTRLHQYFEDFFKTVPA
ncbi:MAG TPA: DUF4129 domain-containing protein [Puia sp.]|nr:DUF4129 domain-containing protein [Puia sp.]